MASLTQVAITTRKIIRYGIYFIIFLIIARLVFGIGKTLYRTLFPKPPPPPTVAFGKLPDLPFPENKDLPGLEYQVETAQGELPTLANQAKVYFMPKSTSHLLALSEAKKTASSLGFGTNAQQISETLYRFSHPKNPASLEMNIVSQIFSLNYDLTFDPTPLNKQPPAPEVAISTARNFLSRAGLSADDLTGPTTHEFLKLENGQLVSALSLSEANLIKVNLFRKSYNELPSLTIDSNKANVWFLVSGESSRDKQILAGEFHYFPIEENQSATYPLKTSQAALDELITGQGFVASLGLNQDGKITIRKIYLAYFDAGVEMEFFQPIIVFEGDRGFVAYVAAITADYYGE
jgi:hypothetical protein